MAKALVLFSGGLDSMLTIRILQREGIDVVALHFVTGLEGATIKREIVGIENPDTPQSVCDKFGVPMKTVSLKDKYLEMFFNPEYGGYGSAINPCLDCHILMLREAKRIMESEGFDFVATGEVLGQRPMSQLAKKLAVVTKQSGLEGYLLRPLSALKLPETIVEREGLINRENLYGISGRSRTIQKELVEEFGINKYPEPAGGGCVILDKIYAKKYHELRQFISEDDIDMETMQYLAVGKHFRITDKVKVILGRDEVENDALEKRTHKKTLILKPTYRKGPLAFIENWGDDSSLTDEVLYDCAMIIASYSKEPVDVFDIKVLGKDDEIQKIISVEKDKIDVSKYPLII